MLKGLRAILWILKGALLLVALGALFLWAWSYWRPVSALVWRFEMRTEPRGFTYWEFESTGGEMMIWRHRQRFGGKFPAGYLERMDTVYGDEWHWNGAAPFPLYMLRPLISPSGWTSSFGPVHWRAEARPPSLFFGWHGSGSIQSQNAERAAALARGKASWSEDAQTLVFPCWLIALCTGLWPAVSLSLMVRRRRRARRLARVGHCRSCGYDLRATPEGGGELLAVCPECGGR